MELTFLPSLYYRCRWLHAPVALMVVLCQRTPAVWVVSQLQAFFGANAATVLRSGFVAASMGAYNSVTGATGSALSALPKSPATAKTYETFTLGATYSGSLRPPASIQVTGVLPPGLVVEGADANGIVNASFITISGTPTVTGKYTFNIIGWSGPDGTLVKKSTAYVLNVTAGINPSPAFTLQPASQAVKSGAGVTLSVAVTGVPTPTLQWRKDGTPIPSATAASYNIPSFSGSDAASYTVVATNSVTSTTSNPAVLSLVVPPSILTPPSALNVTLGAGATFSVATAANPLAATYQWRKDGVAIGKATAATYSIPKTTAASTGNYDVVITNLAGSVTSAPALLTVLVKPVITSKLAAKTLSFGQGTTLTVVATGSPAPSYQWKKDGVAIPGAISASYMIPSATAADAGSYTVVVTNSAGSVTSVPVTITVNVSPATLPAGSTVYLTGSSNGIVPSVVEDTLTVYSAKLLSYTDDHAAPAKVGSATGTYAKVGGLGATLKGTHAGVGFTETYALTLTFASPTDGTYSNSHVGASKVTMVDSGTFSLVPPPATAPVPPAALAVGRSLHLTGSGTDVGGNYVVDSTDLVTSTTQATLTDNTSGVPSPVTTGFVYTKPVGPLASVKTTVTSGGSTSTRTIQLLFSTANSGVFLTTGTDAGGAFFEEGAFILTP